jgi:hypothetical protein
MSKGWCPRRGDNKKYEENYDAIDWSDEGNPPAREGSPGSSQPGHPNDVIDRKQAYRSGGGDNDRED